MGRTRPATGRDEALLRNECAALERLAGVLTSTGSPDRRMEQAIRLVRDRLQAVRSGLPHHSVVRPVRPTPCEAPLEGQPAAAEYSELAGASPAMREVYEAIHRVGHSQATVLLRGESGTGKELVARAIHREGPRAAGQFVRLHCAAVTEGLLESELFGHERGAFTGAVETRKGRFELADGGTLFLDEVGDIPLTTQVKLLRVLQDKCFERVGSNRLMRVDVRLISATHRDLESMVRAGMFREDLYYRLNVVPIVLPPLRERHGDIPLLIEHFLSRFNRENDRQVRLGRDVLDLMGRYHWPGNVRELQNCLERLVVMADSDREPVTLATVPSSLRSYFADMVRVTVTPPAPLEPGRSERQPLRASLQAIEQRRLLETLEQCGWVQAKAARMLGLTPRQVAYKIRKYGIQEGTS